MTTQKSFIEKKLEEGEIYYIKPNVEILKLLQECRNKKPEIDIVHPLNTSRLVLVNLASVNSAIKSALKKLKKRKTEMFPTFSINSVDVVKLPDIEEIFGRKNVNRKMPKL